MYLVFISHDLTTVNISKNNTTCFLSKYIYIFDESNFNLYMDTKLPRARNYRRKLDKQEAEQAKLDAIKTSRKVNRLLENLKHYFQTYQKAMQDSLDANPRSTVNKIIFNYDLTTTTVEYKDIIAAVDPSIVADGTLERARRPEQPALVDIMYFRIEKLIELKPGEEAEARPGIPEMVETKSYSDEFEKLVTFKRITQLFYHALTPMGVHLENGQDSTTDGGLYNAELDRLKVKLLDDFNMHVVCLGIDFQSMNNNNNWNKILREQASEIDGKLQDMTAEVNQIFDSALKVNKD